MRELPHTQSCFVCGAANPRGLRLRFETDGRLVRTRFTPKAEHVGFRGVTHGGILVTVLDEIMVWACVVGARKFAFCAELTTRFQRPAQPGGELLIEAELVANRRDRIFEAQAKVRNATNEVVASATGKYMPVQDVDVKNLHRDLVGDVAWLLEQ